MAEPAAPPATPPAAPPLDAAGVLALLQSMTVPKTPEPPPAPKAVVVDPMTEVRNYLEGLSKSAKERDAADLAAAELKKKEALEEKIAKSLKDGDSAKLKDALGHLEAFFATKLGEQTSATTAATKQLHDTIRLSELHTATTGVVWAGAAAGTDAMAKLDALLEVVAGTDGKPIVRGKKDARPAKDVVKDALGSEDFAHFLDPRSRGKGGLGSGHSASPTGTSTASTAETLDAMLIERWSAKEKTAPKFLGLGGRKPA